MASKNLFLSIMAPLVLIGCIITTVPDDRPKAQNSEIYFKQVNIADKNFMIAKVDLDKYTLKIVENQAPPDSHSIRQIHQESGAALTFNGSFYDEKFLPLGLLISDSKLIFPLNKSQLMNGVFTIYTNNRAELHSFDSFQERQSNLLPKIQFAIQSGPILLDQKGQIIIDKKNTKKAGRTAIGLDKDNDLVIIMLRQSLLNQENALTLYDFAHLISTSPELSEFSLHSVINLDGGKSSGLALGNDYFPELEKVQNIITVIRKS